MFDLDAYLERIGLSGEPTLAAMHRAHVTGIPFENLDPRRGVPVSLEIDAITEKLVANRRGGYCFEHNMLFKAALEALGTTVTPLLARVRNGHPPDPPGALNHLLLRVETAGAVWHADVGFGPGTLLEPIPFGPGGPYEQSGWQFRVDAEEAALVLRSRVESEWRDTYVFEPKPAVQADIDVSNWHTCTHPDSSFVRGLIVANQDKSGTRRALRDAGGELVLSVQTPAGTTREPVARSAVQQLVSERFGLPGELVSGPFRSPPAPGDSAAHI